MAFVSVTRLRVRGLRFLPGFLFHTLLSARSAERAPGFVAGQLASERGLVFWTMTVWKDPPSMRAYRNASPHLDAMRRLIDWCSEGSYAHWETDAPDVPSPEECHRRLLDEGKLSKVRNPSALHLAGRTAGDAQPKPARPLRPRRGAP